ncbi:MAG: sugar-binding domain-containing protein, partial [Bacteroidota bacterium]
MILLILLCAIGSYGGAIQTERTSRSTEKQPDGHIDKEARFVRERLLLDFGWRFHLGDAASIEGDFGFGSRATFAKAGEAVGAAKPDFNDSSWRKVDLPHDWAVELEFVNMKDDDVKNHGFKPIGRRFPKTSIGWYRRAFAIPKTDEGKRLAVKFDGVFRDCNVWINGHYLGENLSGYSEFSYDISDYVKYGERNVLVVRVDASHYEGWFYEGAGIYRHTWLLKYSALHIPQYGTFVTTGVGENAARVNVETKIFNQSESKAEYQLSSIILDEKGNTVGSTSSQLLGLNGQEQETLLQQITVRNPEIWSLESPHLYTLVSLVESGNEVVDRVETTFGIRT